MGHLTVLSQLSFILFQAGDEIAKVLSASKLPADVTVLRGDRARPRPQRGLVQTLPGQPLALTLGASSSPSPCCRFLLPTVRMESSPRDVPENHMGSCSTFLVLTRYQVFDLQLSCMKKEKRNSRDSEKMEFSLGSRDLGALCLPTLCPPRSWLCLRSLQPLPSHPVTMFPTVGKAVLGPEPSACRL